MNARKILGAAFGLLATTVVSAVFLWLILVAVYGAAGSTPVKASLLYNTPAQEARTVWVYIPIFSFIVGFICSCVLYFRKDE